MAVRKRKVSVFDVINVLFMIFIIFITLYPMYYVVISSISDLKALTRHDGFLWKPLEPLNLSAYKALLSSKEVLGGFKNTLIQLGLGLAVNMVMTTLGAYFLSLKTPMFKLPVNFMIIFTMYFSGGMVPAYLNMKDLGLLNSVWSLVLPGAIGTANLIMLRTAFNSIPDSLTESAKLDGASDLTILTRVLIPLSKATLAVLVLYYGVGHWNSWFSASIYLRDRDLYPLQLVARNILILGDDGSFMGEVGMLEESEYSDVIKNAMVVISTVPILALYPFLQKYFVKGVMVGALKG